MPSSEEDQSEVPFPAPDPRERTRIEWDFQTPISPPEHATEILLIRHGSTGERDKPQAPSGTVAEAMLNELGRHQAQEVASALGEARIDGIFATPFQRTSDSAAPIAEMLGIEIELVPELREIHLGDWAGGEFGRRLKSRDPLIGEMFHRQRWDVLPGAEKAADFAARVSAGLDHVVEATGPGKRAAVFTHGGVIAEACRQATGSEPFSFLLAENCSFTSLFLAEGKKPLLHRFNVTSHLSVESSQTLQPE